MGFPDDAIIVDWMAHSIDPAQTGTRKVNARQPRGPTVYQAPRCPIDRLAPSRLTFTRKHGRIVKRAGDGSIIEFPQRRGTAPLKSKGR
jgi:hypothetical protein